MNKARVLLLIPLALLATSGLPSAAPQRVAASPSLTPRRPAPNISQSLAQLNPHLAPAELHRIDAAIHRYSRKYGLDPLLVAAVIEVESAARPWVRSPKGALGLMQVMPYMMRPMGLAGNPSTIEANIEAGCMILSHNIERLGEADGISAYFWGSDIRGASYLNRVREARERLRAEMRS